MMGGVCFISTPILFLLSIVQYCLMRPLGCVDMTVARGQCVTTEGTDCTIPGRQLDLISNYEKVISKIDLRLRYVRESFKEN
jgi:hypothetical protein